MWKIHIMSPCKSRYLPDLMVSVSDSGKLAAQHVSDQSLYQQKYVSVYVT